MCLRQDPISWHMPPFVKVAKSLQEEQISCREKGKERRTPISFCHEMPYTTPVELCACITGDWVECDVPRMAPDGGVPGKTGQSMDGFGPISAVI